MSLKKYQSQINVFEEKFDFWLDQLKGIVKIPSVSFDLFDKKYLDECSVACNSIFKSIGLKTEILKIPEAPAYIYAEHLVNKSLPTVLFYAHYDVQPPMREQKWETLPFDPVIKNGRMYGRGTADDKAGIVLHAASIDAFLKSNNANSVNIKVLIEGEEEIGSPNLHKLLKKYKNKFQSDCLVLADMSNFKAGIPTITTSLRGLAAIEVEVSTIDHPLHSGMWGGPLPDPIMELSKILAGLVDSKNRIAIPEIYKMIKPLKSHELKILNSLPNNHKNFKKNAYLVKGASLTCKKDDNIWKTLWKEPSIVINSIESGGKAIAGNTIMDKAWARIGIRTVPDMDSNIVLKLLTKKIKSLASDYVKLNIKPAASTEPWVTDTDHKFFKIMENALNAGYGKQTVFAGCGGSIPFANTFSKALGNIPALLIGVEDPNSNPHSENESLNLSDFKLGISSQILFLNIINDNKGGNYG